MAGVKPEEWKALAEKQDARIKALEAALTAALVQTTLSVTEQNKIIAVLEGR